MNEKVLEALKNYEPTKEDVERFNRMLKDLSKEHEKPLCGLELTVEQKIWQAMNNKAT